MTAVFAGVKASVFDSLHAEVHTGAEKILRITTFLDTSDLGAGPKVPPCPNN